MQVSAFFIIAALIGCVTSGKNDCWFYKSIECALNLMRIPESDNSFCGRHMAEMNCAANPAIQCDLNFKSTAENLKSVWEKICEKETNIHKQLDENVGCFMKGLSDPKCTKSVANLEKEGKYDDMILLQKEACKYFDETKQCQYQSIIDNCGKPVAALYKTTFEPAIELERAVCEEIILPQVGSPFTAKRSVNTPLVSFLPLGLVF
ncbi:uncharacterized protein CDAR_119431 [Caerostris darwini]|uniref:DUF19 domain-containing protein n=1 Tax=Caerostris darwini TaxID=1538125 RepID=A0AAV4U4B9_9ARAC|nr:uncharacterized protein CDAR_119431 [Caerostris darwini]